MSDSESESDDYNYTTRFCYYCDDEIDWDDDFCEYCINKYCPYEIDDDL